MSNLDNYHPFRQSVNLKDGSSSNTMSSSEAHNSGSDGNGKDEKDYIPLLSWKTKLRLLIGGFALSFLLYIGGTVYDYLAPLLAPFGKNKSHAGQNVQSDFEGAHSAALVFDKNDLNERGREVSSARKKAGFFASMFCKGGKKSSFCE